jgi:transcriptional regulator GlxA family with amidase domain
MAFPNREQSNRPGALFCANFQPLSAKLTHPASPRTELSCIMFAEVQPSMENGFRGRKAPECRRVVMLVLPPFEELDLIGPVEVFSTASRLLGREKPAYSFHVVTNSKSKKLAGDCGLSLVADGHYRDVKGAFDSLLLICGVEARNTRDTTLFAWMRDVAPKVRRLGSVCVGAFLLAGAGLLNGRRATSHWKFAGELARRHPRVLVDPSPIWTKDGNIYTSAGVSAGIDLALAWVEEDFGSALALDVARELVLFVRRPSGQTQFSVSLAAQASEVRPIQDLQIWIAENLHQKLSSEILADRMAMSVRNFERVFAREVGKPPSQYVLQTRVEAARRQLERTDRGLDQIAVATGFSSADLMRRAFLRILRITPRQYRNQFRPPTAGLKQQMES